MADNYDEEREADSDGGRHHNVRPGKRGHTNAKSCPRPALDSIGRIAIIVRPGMFRYFGWRTTLFG